MKEDKQFLIWHEAIAIYRVNNSIKTALTLLNNALKITVTNIDFLTERNRYYADNGYISCRK